MKNFHNASHLLSNQSGLQARFRQDGYLYLKQVVSRQKLLALRRQILGICHKNHWLKPGEKLDDGISWTTPKVEGEDDYFAVYDEIQKLETFHALAHDSSIIRVMHSLLGASAFPHPLSICRLVFPDSDLWATPPHQDYPNNQGSEDLYACWIPLSDCPREQGALEILAGSHTLGLLPLKYSLGAGHRQADLGEKAAGLRWTGGDFALGDILVFHSLTVHRSQPNTKGQLRISVDYRYQAEHQPLTERCLQPHFGRLSWEQIYQGWRNSELPYYWRQKSFEIVPWRPQLQELPDEHLAEAVRMKRDFDQQRLALKNKYDRQSMLLKDTRKESEHAGEKTRF